MIGSVVDARYEVLERISEGTFFTVFKAQDRVVGREVALKVLHPRYAVNKEFSARLRSELTAASALTHSSVARIYEVGESQGITYVATEFVRGADLKERVRRAAPLPFSETTDLLIQIAEALSYAHRAGVVHGDVTPQNAIVTPEMEVKLTDFGVSPAAVGSALVQSNAMLRGVHYLAPEVAEGNEATPASDVYSMGVILFEMLTGSLPFTGDTPLVVALKHAQEPAPNPRSLNPSVPQALGGIALKALSKNPADRYPSALAMLRDLRRAQECIRMGRSLSWSPVAGAAADTRESARAPAVEQKPARGDLWRTVMAVLLVIIAALGLGVAAFLFTGFGLPKDVTVPPIVGKPRAQAAAMLAEVNLQLKVVEERYSTDPVGTILFATPEPGRQLKEGREIRVSVSRGPEQTTVPDVLHSTLTEAQRSLKRAGLEVGHLRTVYDDIVPKGQILAQEPGPEKGIAKGGKVALTISKGPEIAPDTPVVTPADEDPPTAPAPPPEPPPAPQRWEVSVDVPAGTGEQPVRIVVLQNERESEVYNAPHPAGDRFSHTVETTGRAVIRVYIAGNLVREQEVGQ